MMEKEKKKIIIYTDCGSDDAMAIAMALNDLTYEIQLITTVSGNVPVQQATINTLTTIEYAGTYEPPVYMGCEKMLLRELECACRHWRRRCSVFRTSTKVRRIRLPRKP